MPEANSAHKLAASSSAQRSTRLLASAKRAQTMAGREKRNGLNRHPDLPRVWVSNPIEFLTTEEVWAWLLQKPNPWGGDNRALYKLYASTSNGECPIQIDTSTPSCGHSRFGCWTCTVVERDNWVARASRLRASATRRRNSEGLLASGDERMEKLIEFRETRRTAIPGDESGIPNQSPFDNRPSALSCPANGKRDLKRKNGSDGPGPLTIEARRELLARLLALQEEVGFKLISDDELFLIQQQWKSARRPDDGAAAAGGWESVSDVVRVDDEPSRGANERKGKCFERLSRRSMAQEGRAERYGRG